MRIASMLPSATEIAYLLGLGDQVVGVSHECDYPPDARNKPVITQAPFDATVLSSQEIDTRVSESVTSGRELYHVDASRIVGLAPDLILTQGLCDVCAVSVSALRGAALEGPKVLALDAGTLEGVLQDIQRVADACGVSSRGKGAVTELQERIERIRQRASNIPAVRTACLEWIDPPYNAGHWVPQMVEYAGGVETISRKGQFSSRIAWERVVESNPDVLILMPCGFGKERAAAEVELLKRLEGWTVLPAVQNGRVWAVDANSYFSRPGPRLVDGLELAASILHPEVFGEPDACSAVRVS